MAREQVSNRHITVDLGPTTVIVLAELLFVMLKLMNQITYSWTFILLPILIVIGGAALILLTTLMKLLKQHLF